MGILKAGKECIIMQGKDFGKKINIEKVQDNKVYYKKDNKEKSVGILHVFPL